MDPAAEMLKAELELIYRALFEVYDADLERMATPPCTNSAAPTSRLDVSDEAC